MVSGLYLCARAYGQWASERDAIAVRALCGSGNGRCRHSRLKAVREPLLRSCCEAVKMLSGLTGMERHGHGNEHWGSWDLQPCGCSINVLIWAVVRARSVLLRGLTAQRALSALRSFAVVFHSAVDGGFAFGNRNPFLGLVAWHGVMVPCRY